MKHPKLVLIEWFDSVQPEPAWRYLQDAPDLDIVLCRSVGWLIGEDKYAKMLAPNVGELRKGDSQQGSGFVRIPRIAILRQVELIEKRHRKGKS